MALRKERVITLTPHIAVDERSERHAYSVLLQYSDWEGGEENLLRGCSSAITRLGQIFKSLPAFVTDSLMAKQQQEELFNNTPDLNDVAQPPDDVADAEDFDNTFNTNANNYPGVTPENVDIPEHCSIIRNAKKSNMAYLSNFIKNRYEEFKHDRSRKFSLTSAEYQTKLADVSLHFAIENDQLLREELDITITKFNVKQREVYDVVISHVTDPNAEQMIFFLSGPGGAGNS